jgi:hypothetical protein
LLPQRKLRAWINSLLPCFYSTQTA